MRDVMHNCDDDDDTNFGDTCPNAAAAAAATPCANLLRPQRNALIATRQVFKKFGLLDGIKAVVLFSLWHAVSIYQ